MTINEKKSYLSQYIDAINEYDTLIGTYEYFKDKILSLKTPELTDMPKTYQPSKEIETNVIKLIQIEEVIRQRQDKLLDLRLSIEKSISTLKNPLHRNIIEMRFIKGYTMKQISEYLFYCRVTCNRLYAIAMEQIKICS